MEFLNKVHLRGIVGTSDVKDFQGKKYIRYSIVTEYAYMNQNNEATVETFWINVIAYEGKNISGEDILNIKKGTKIEVIGRLKSTSYTDTEGNRRSVVGVVANEIHILNEESLKIPEE